MNWTDVRASRGGCNWCKYSVYSGWCTETVRRGHWTGLFVSAINYIKDLLLPFIARLGRVSPVPDKVLNS